MKHSVNDLIAEYRQSAIEHGTATESGDHKKANKAHDRLVQILRRLREQGAEGDHALLDLLRDESLWVRVWAGTHCLRVDKDLARRTLESISAESGVPGFTADMVLSEWDKGTLRIP